MNQRHARSELVLGLLRKADRALAAARREAEAGDLELAINRVYYACFYSASALLLQENKHFSKHSGVRAALHQHVVKAGRLPSDLGAFYDQAFEERQEADYSGLATFDAETVTARINSAELFVSHMKALLDLAPKGE